MAPLGNQAYNRLLNLLHAKTVPEIRQKVSVVKRVLYDHETSTDSETSVLDDMMHSPWEQKPMSMAVKEVENAIPKVLKSNVLRLKCPIAQVGRADLHNIYPITRDRHFALPELMRKGLQFHVVKARNPISLLFTGSYYLVFANYNQACLYYLESKGKLINGFEVDLDFVYPNKTHLKYMGSPVLHQKKIDAVEGFDDLSEKFKQLDCLKIFRGSETQLKIITELEKVKRDRSAFMNLDKDPLFEILEYFMDVPTRYSLVVVRNLPLGVTKPLLSQLLWNYEFATENNPQDSMGIIHSSSASQVTLALMRFKDETNARRFVRNYHGRPWNKISNSNVKPLYEPIRCEIID